MKSCCKVLPGTSNSARVGSVTGPATQSGTSSPLGRMCLAYITSQQGGKTELSCVAQAVKNTCSETPGDWGSLLGQG